MSAKRKDKKGRVLRRGESQRKDLTYQYRYQDIKGKRRTVYAPTLEELRAKEEEINNAVNIGVMKPAFQMAYEEDILRKNPFDFKLSDAVKNDSQKRIALT